MTTRSFHLGDILSITTGRLVSPRHMEGVLDILTWMAGERPEIHQIPRVTGECRGPLLAQHPDLAAVIPPEFTSPGRPFQLQAWLTVQVRIYGETREVEPLTAGKHAQLDLLADVLLINPDIEITVVELPPEPES